MYQPNEPNLTNRRQIALQNEESSKADLPSVDRQIDHRQYHDCLEVIQVKEVRILKDSRKMRMVIQEIAQLSKSLLVDLELVHII